MKDELKIVALIIGGIVLSVSMALSYNLYTNAKNREMYEKCLQVHGSPTTFRSGVGCYV